MKKKFKIKSLELTIDMLVAVIAEMTIEKAFAKIPIPNYSIGQAYDKSDLKIPDYKQNSTYEKIICDDSQPFCFAPIEDYQKIIPKPIDSLKSCLVNGIPHDLEHKGNGIYLIKDNANNFQKGMLEADRELQKTCKNIEVDCKCLGQDFIHEIVEFEFNAKSCRQKKCFGCGKITVTHRYNT